MPAEMQGGKNPGPTTSDSAAEAKKNDTVTADDEPGPAVVQGEQKAGGRGGGGGGLREIQGIVDSMSDLRKRKGAKARSGESAAPDCPTSGKEVTEKMAPSGEWHEWVPPFGFYVRAIRHESVREESAEFTSSR